MQPKQEFVLGNINSDSTNSTSLRVLPIAAARSAATQDTGATTNPKTLCGFPGPSEPFTAAKNAQRVSYKQNMTLRLSEKQMVDPRQTDRVVCEKNALLEAATEITPDRPSARPLPQVSTFWLYSSTH